MRVSTAVTETSLSNEEKDLGRRGKNSRIHAKKSNYFEKCSCTKNQDNFKQFSFPQTIIKNWEFSTLLSFMLETHQPRQFVSSSLNVVQDFPHVSSF